MLTLKQDSIGEQTLWLREPEAQQYHDLPRRAADSSKRSSISLSNLGLSALFLIFVLFLVALSYLYYLDKHDEGLPLFTHNHYIWTYGPTALLIVTTSFWRQIDYHCKALIPWRELEHDTRTTPDSIFLDYLTPLQVVTLYRATKNRHYVVVLTILGFFVLKAVVVASTSLLLPVTVTIGPQSVELVRMTMLNGSGYDYEAPTEDPSTMYTAYASIANDYPLPEGTTNHILFETLRQRTQIQRANATISAPVSAFVPEISCEPFDAFVDLSSITFDNTTAMVSYNLNISRSQSCPSGYAEDSNSGGFSVLNPRIKYCPPRQLVPFTSFLHQCSGDDKVDRKYGLPFLLGMFDFRYNQTFNTSMQDVAYGSPAEPTYWSFEIASTNALMCRLAYTVKEVQVTYDMSESQQQIVTKELSSSPAHLPGFNNSDLQNEFKYTLLYQSRLFDSYNDGNFGERRMDFFFETMASLFKTNYSSFMDNKFLETAASQTFAVIAAQIGKKCLAKNDTTTVPGQISYNEQRLRVQLLPFWLMVIGLSVIMLMTIVLYFIRPLGPSATGFQGLSNVPSIHKHSLEYDQTIIALASKSSSDASTILSNTQLKSDTQDGKLSIGVCERLNINKIEPCSSKQEWWTPFPLSNWFAIGTLVVTSLTTAALQLLQGLSDRHDGIASMASDSSILVIVYTRALPALYMLLVATMYNAIDFNTILLAPLAALRRRPSAYKILRSSLLAQLPPLALIQSLRFGYWAAFATTIMTFIASVITIVVSGLYTVEELPNTVSTTVNIVGEWNTSWQSSLTADNQSSMISSLVETANLTYPRFTYDELAFPEFKLSASHNATWYNTSGNIRLRVPALRAELTCTNISSDRSNFTILTTSVGRVFDRALVAADILLPKNCQRGSQYGNDSFIQWGANWTGYTDNASYFGTFTDLLTGPFSSSESSELTYNEPFETRRSHPDNPPGCPSVILSYGFGNANDTSQNRATVLMCYQGLKSIDTDVTLSLPDLTISTESPPVPVESSAKFLHSGPNNEIAFPWRLQFHIQDRFKLLNKPPSVYREWQPRTPALAQSSFFAGVLYGKTPIPIESLADSDRPQEMLDHIQKFYRRYMAQAISANMRTSIGSDSTRVTDVRSNNQLTAQFTPLRGISRIIQHAAPTLILQIMLSLMFILEVANIFLSRSQDLVVWNPCTIMGMSILFVGSKMVTEPYPTLGPEVEPESDNYHAPPTYPHSTTTKSAHTASVRSIPNATDISHHGDEVFARARASERSKPILRLGWWRNGEYVEVDRKRSKELLASREPGWRYGIDIVN